MAAQWAKTQKLNECLVLNQHDRVCDATIANVFFVKDGMIYTPQLDEGCINGVMRRHLVEQFSHAGISLTEGVYLPDEIKASDEIFLTNAMYGLRWVKQWDNRTYSSTHSSAIFHRFISPLFL